MDVGAVVFGEQSIDRDAVEALGTQARDLFGVFGEEGGFVRDHVATIWNGDVADPVNSAGLEGENGGVGIFDGGRDD